MRLSKLLPSMLAMTPLYFQQAFAGRGRFTSPLTFHYRNGSVHTANMTLTPELELVWEQYDSEVDAQTQIRGGAGNWSMHTPSQFENFDLSNPDDKHKVDQITQALRDAVNIATITLVRLEADSVNFEHAPAYTRYFGACDWTYVASVYDLTISGTDPPSPDGAVVLGTIIWDNLDFWVDPNLPLGAPPPFCDTNPDIVAYTANRETDDKKSAYGRLHMCDHGFTFPLLSACKDPCEEIAGKVSSLMSTMGGCLIHEWAHVNQIGRTALTGRANRIKDVDNGYGAYEAMQLSDDDSLFNADNYRWFAQETFYFDQCGKIPFQAPEKDDDSGWLPQSCQVQK